MLKDMDKIVAAFNTMLEKFGKATDGKVVVDAATFDEIKASKNEMETLYASLKTESEAKDTQLKTKQEELDKVTASLNLLNADKIIAATETALIQADQNRIIEEKNHEADISNRKAILAEKGINSERLIARAINLKSKEEFDEFVLDSVEARNMSLEANKNKDLIKAQAEIVKEQEAAEKKIKEEEPQMPAGDEPVKGFKAEIKKLAQDTANESKESRMNKRKEQNA